MHCIDLKICSHMLSVRQGFGCVLAEYKRPALRERRETAKRFKAPNRPREARRAAAMEPGHTRTPADNGTEMKPVTRKKLIVNNKAEKAP